MRRSESETSVDRLMTYRRCRFCGSSRLSGASAGGDHLHRNLRRQENLQASLEGTFDQLVQRATAAGADKNLFAPANSCGFGQQLSGIVAGVVQRNDRHAIAVPVLQ